MPEFLFRRKKTQGRQKVSVSDALEAQQEKLAAASAPKDQGKKKDKQNDGASASGGSGSKGAGRVKVMDSSDTLRREKKQFMELYKNKYPEDAARLGLTNGTTDADVGGARGGVGVVNGDDARALVNGERHQLNSMTDDSDGQLLPSSSDEMSHDQSHDSSDSFIKTTSSADLPVITTTPRKISKYDECLFLRYRKAIRRCPMPSPITLSTLKNLFVNMFDLSPTLLDNTSCSLYIQDKVSQQWELLGSMSMVTDHCTVQLKDRSSKRSHKRGASQGDAPNITTSLDLPTLKSHQQKQETSASHGSLNSKTLEKLSSGGASVDALFKAGSHGDVDVLEKTASSFSDLGASKPNSLLQSGRSYEIDDLTMLSDNHPLHPQNVTTSSGSDVIMTSPFSITSSTSGISSDPQIDQKKLSSMALSLKSSVKKLKSDMADLRRDHIHQTSSFSLSLLQAKQKIVSSLSAAISVGKLGSSSVMLEGFRKERIKVNSMKKDYDGRAKPMLHELELLDSAVESLRIDVVNRRCRVSEREVLELTNQVNTIAKTIKQLEGLYSPLEDMLKQVMERELQVIVREEKFVEEEGPRLDDALDKCHNLQTTLHNLNQYAVVQTQRTPLIPYFGVEPDPDRHALMENIQSLHPNHKLRAKELSKAEIIMERRKEFTSTTKAELREFENELRSRKGNLRHVRRLSDIESHRLMKAKEIFLKEKDVRKRQLEEELQLQGKLAVKKREQEKRQLEEYMRQHNIGHDKLPAPGPVRKARSDLSMDSVHVESMEGLSNRYRVPMHSSRSDDQVLPQFPPYKSGKGVLGGTPFHGIDETSSKRHTVQLADSLSFASSGQQAHYDGFLSQDAAPSSMYDSLEKVKESYKSTDSAKSKARSSTIGHGRQLKIYQSPLGQQTTMHTSTSTASTVSASSSNSSTGTRLKRSSNSGGQVNLQALTMLPSASNSSSKAGNTGSVSASSSGKSYSSKAKQTSPLVTKRIDAKGGGGGEGKGMSDFTPHSSGGGTTALISPTSQSVSKVQNWRKAQQHMNGLPSRYQTFDYNSQPDGFGYNDYLMDQSSLSQPIGSLSQPVEFEEMNYRQPYHHHHHHRRRAGFSPDIVPVRTEGRDKSQTTGKNFYRSASDESVYDTLRTSSRNSRASIHAAKDFNVKESKNWAKSFALSVFSSFSSSDKKGSKNKHRKSRDDDEKGGQSSSSGSKGGQGASVFGGKAQSRFHHTYSHHTPKSLKGKGHKKGEPTIDDQMEHKSVRFTSQSGSRQQNLVASSGSVPHPNSAPSLATVSARSPPSGKRSDAVFSGDSPLTSYPRSHTQAMHNMRGHTNASSGRPVSHYMVNVGRANGTNGRSYHDRQSYHQNGQFKSSLSNGNLTDTAKLGSLV